MNDLMDLVLKNESQVEPETQEISILLKPLLSRDSRITGFSLPP